MPKTPEYNYVEPIYVSEIVALRGVDWVIEATGYSRAQIAKNAAGEPARKVLEELCRFLYERETADKPVPATDSIVVCRVPPEKVEAFLILTDSMSINVSEI